MADCARVLMTDAGRASTHRRALRILTIGTISGVSGVNGMAAYQTRHPLGTATPWHSAD